MSKVPEQRREANKNKYKILCEKSQFIVRWIRVRLLRPVIYPGKTKKQSTHTHTQYTFFWGGGRGAQKAQCLIHTACSSCPFAEMRFILSNRVWPLLSLTRYATADRKRKISSADNIKLFTLLSYFLLFFSNMRQRIIIIECKIDCEFLFKAFIDEIVTFSSQNI